MCQNIRVLHVMTDPVTGVMIVEPIARRQLVDGYHVEFACGSGEYLGPLTELGFPVNILPMSRKLISLDHLRYFFALRRLLKKKHFDIIHFHTTIASFIGRLAAASANTNILIDHLRITWWDSPNPFVRFIFDFAQRIALPVTTHIFTINCSDAKNLIRRRIARQHQVTCLHCGRGGIDIEKFNPARFTHDQVIEARSFLGLSSHDFVIGFIGRIVKEKGIFELLAAFEHLVKKYPDVRLALVGGVLASERDQHSFMRLAWLIKDRALSDKVIQTGFRSDIPSLISTFDVLVLPSYQEGFGSVLAEASAMGCPVIATATPGGLEAVVDGKNGLLVPLRDSLALRDAIERLYLDPDLRKQMGRAGRQIAIERYDETVVYAAIRQTYLRLTGGLDGISKGS